MDKYYYSDAIYQLEINLHKVRQELITMIEFFEKTDCSTCLQLKCKCTTTKTNSDSEKSNSDLPAPPAETLPKPKWDKNYESPAPLTPEKKTVNQDIEAWIEASRKGEEHIVKHTIPIVNTKKSLVTIESVRPADIPLKNIQKQHILNKANLINNVKAFEALFSYLKPSADNTNIINTSTKFAAEFNKQNRQNYSYF